jgi:hypothetical protein
VGLVARLMGADPVMPAAAGGTGFPGAGDPAAMLLQWGAATLWLCFKMLLIITAVMCIMAWMRLFNAVPRAQRLLTPLLRLLRLPSEVGLLWFTAAVFGISYGGAVIVAEARRQALPPESLARLHLSIGINHAMIEDPLLFLALGVPAVWLWLPRLLAAAGAVCCWELWRHVIRQRGARRPVARARPPLNETRLNAHGVRAQKNGGGLR